METLLAVLAGALTTSAIWLLLSGNLLRFLFGLLLLSNAVNLAIFVAGRLTRGQPALLGEDGALPGPVMADALPQALLLTAIVIGFGLFAFALALTLRSYRAFGHLEIDRMRLAESQSPAEALVEPGPHSGQGLGQDLGQDSGAQAGLAPTAQPAQKQPARKQAAQTPVAQTPVGQQPVGQTPAAHRPAGHSPAAHSPAAHRPDSQRPAADEPAEDAP